MQKVTFSIDINASKETAWQIMLADASYREWSNVFCEGSYAVTDWKEGSKARFLSPSGDGMFSRIARHRPAEFLSIEHLGVIKNGADVEAGDAQGWAGAHENYSIRDIGGGVSRLTIEMDSTDEYKGYFDETWPKALARLKEVVEANRRAAVA